jgi:hypothetical protein
MKYFKDTGNKSRKAEFLYGGRSGTIAVKLETAE